MKAALVQLTSGDDPAVNLAITAGFIAGAADRGATLICTPEVTNCVSQDRAHQRRVLHHQDDDPTLAALREQAAALGIWLSIGSLALKTDDPDGRFANRSFLIDPRGNIAAQYDKIHMFDVTVSETESYRESAGYRPGDRAVLAQADDLTLGLTVCYDLRFAYLYRTLAQAGAQVLLVPSAFSPVTGAAHWHTLLRARAIETGCYVLAAAQTGTHAATAGRPRETYGHTLAVAPWGEVIADAGTEMGVTLVDLDAGRVDQARGRVASLTHDRTFRGPL
ncbi:carbon-nitrogen hydrolase family protein [Loktanella sp. SALINAS62]|uniref:carbon-nitrogen hydrolase family protein n=1 Tax=Loktanella sp. SALINAS62 TaxID=2706124 RepID=UPI001B8BA8F8|nr:carbon-nitrogen hydrolase family protein [Loktanella sp. SALINAS62]MBS1302480.1 carbon-nitrogen hydrolase family protein [Loktanella sp. SALINAS62]